MANKKKALRKQIERARRILAASQTPQQRMAVAQVAVPVKEERSGLIVSDLLGSFAEQTGANFG